MKLCLPLMLALPLIVSGCEPPPTPGFEGTWANSNPNYGSTLVFRGRSDGGYDIRYDVDRPQSRFRVLCPWEGPCQEFGDGELVALWDLESWIDETSGLPRLKSTRRMLEDSIEIKAIWRIDEFELGADGLTITAWTCETQDMVYPPDKRGKRGFHKLTDRVREPKIR